MLGISYTFNRIPASLEFRDALGVDQEMQRTGALAHEICPEVRTKGKLTACNNDYELHYKEKRGREGGGERRKGSRCLFSLLFPREQSTSCQHVCKKRRQKRGLGRQKTTGKEYALR